MNGWNIRVLIPSSYFAMLSFAKPHAIASEAVRSSDSERSRTCAISKIPIFPPRSYIPELETAAFYTGEAIDCT